MQKILLSFAFALGSLSLPCAAADEFPNKPIRMLVPFAPGGGADIIARLLGPRLTERVGQSVIVDNRPAAAGIEIGRAHV